MFQNICIVVGCPGSEFPSRRSLWVSLHVALWILFAFLLGSILTFHGCSSGSSSLLQGLESEGFPPSSPLLSPSPAVAVLLPNICCLLLARCRCPELFCKGQTLYICLLQGNICTAAKVSLTCTANPILLLSLSVVLPLATSLLWLQGRYLNKLASHLTNLSVTPSLQRWALPLDAWHRFKLDINWRINFFLWD